MARKKRKFADPIAAAAMLALSSSSDGSDDDDEYDDDTPIIKKKKFNACTMDKMDGHGGSEGGSDSRGEGRSTNDDIRHHIKPLFKVEEEVYAAWWSNKRRTTNPSWHSGTIKAYHTRKNTKKNTTKGTTTATNTTTVGSNQSQPYGPTRYYDIQYDDGDYLEGVEDHYVFQKLDYVLMMKNDGRSSWIGVRNVVDSDAVDNWARIVGWYVASIDGNEKPFSLLSDAMNAYDTSVVRHAMESKNKIKRSELNRPEQYSYDLFDNSDGDDSEDDDDHADDVNSTCDGESSGSKDGQNDRNIQSLERNDSTAPSPKIDSIRNDSTTTTSSPRKHQKAHPNTTPSPPVAFSTYKGLTYNKQDKKYLAQINYGNKLHCLGYYKYETDAALAIDKGSMLSNNEGSSPKRRNKYNFSTKREYEDAIREEAERSFGGGRGRQHDNKDNDNLLPNVDVVDRYDAVVGKVEVYLSKILAARNNYVADVEDLGKNATAEDLGKNNNNNNNTSNKNADEDSEHDDKDSNVSNPSSSLQPTKEISGNNDVSKTASVSKKAQRKSSVYTGVAYNKRNGKYSTNITHGGGRCFLGYYELQADAAIAYDEAVKLLRGEDDSKINFTSGHKEYITARKKELLELTEDDSESASTTETLMEIAVKIQKYLTKIPCPEITAMNDAMAEKWGHVLPTETGKEYHKLYKKSIDDIFGDMKRHRDKRGSSSSLAPSIVSDKQDDICDAGMEIELGHGKNPDADFRFVTKGNTDGSSKGENVSNKAGMEKESGHGGKTPDAVIRPIADGNTDGTSQDRNAPSETDMEIESGQGKAPDAVVRPIAEGNTDDSSQDRNAQNKRSPQWRGRLPEPENDSDDDVSLFSDDTEGNDAKQSDAEKANACPDTNTEILHASLNHNNDGTIKGSRDIIKEFPIGCPVLWDLDSSSFRRGMVTSAPIHDDNNDTTTYEVMPTIGGRSTTIPERSLAYGLNCPVYVSHGSESHVLGGKILFCKPCCPSSNDSEGELVSYTILIDREHNQFQVMNNIPSERVKYREVLQAEVPVHSNENAAPSGRGSIVIHGEVPSQPKKTVTAGLAPTPAEENGSQMSSRKFFSSNSTITSLDSAPATSHHGRVDDTSGHDGDSSVEVYFPHWLVHDSASKQRLISYLLWVDTEISDHHRLHRIGRSSNCILRIVESGDFHVLIETISVGKYATEDTRKAEEKLEHALLEYIQRDGSSGRLFYDMAWSCEFLHPKGNAQSTSVMQRNPFSSNKEMGWMNIVEFPCSRVPSTHRKKYQDYYVFAKRSGLLGRIKHETRCEIKLCGDDFNVPTKLCAPYVWVMGHQPGLVDRAVDILRDSIQSHMGM